MSDKKITIASITSWREFLGADGAIGATRVTNPDVYITHKQSTRGLYEADDPDEETPI